MSTLPVGSFESVQENAPLTAGGLLKRRAEQRPGVVALADPSNLSDLGLGPPRSLSYREADMAADALAAFFTELGLIPATRSRCSFPTWR
jgi:non-ribosomal peptide synthetase component E (peptide arylation enzyme)